MLILILFTKIHCLHLKNPIAKLTCHFCCPPWRKDDYIWVLTLIILMPIQRRRFAQRRRARHRSDGASVRLLRSGLPASGRQFLPYIPVAPLQTVTDKAEYRPGAFCPFGPCQCYTPGPLTAAPAGAAPAPSPAPPRAVAPPLPRPRLRAGAMAAGALRGVLWPRAAAGLRAARAALAAPAGARAGEREAAAGAKGRRRVGVSGARAGGCGVGAGGRCDLPGPAAGGARAHCAALLSRSLGDVPGHDARAVSADSGGAGGRCEEVQHAGRGLSALPRRWPGMHWDFDMYIRNRVDTSPTVVPWHTMSKHFLLFLSIMLIMFGLGEIYPSYRPVGPKQYPFNDLYLEKGGDPNKKPPTVIHYEI
uniref:NADH:ubiquinone oxidoreductase subunit B8 n=1 Tax=Taeniopygia guttata TaxID=59729 RepID=A0A674HKD4_TAEGU